MEDIWPQLSTWVKNGRRFALATVIRVQRSSPRGVGACLAVSEDGSDFIGSVSAGCVENEVFETAKRCMVDGRARHLEFGPDIGYPWEVSLSCGGKIEVRVEPYWAYSNDECNRELSRHLGELLENKSVAMLVSGRENHALFDLAGEFIAGDRSFGARHQIEALRRLKADSPSEKLEIGDESVFFRRLSPRPRIFIIGAVHIATHLVQIALTLNYETIVIDPRSAYSKVERFPIRPDILAIGHPKEVLDEFNLRGTDVGVALTHDPKIDDPALACLLKGDCGYIGALGSNRSHASRIKRLRKIGVIESDLERISGPVGLDIGSQTPAEIAVSIAAEVIATQRKSKQ